MSTPMSINKSQNSIVLLSLGLLLVASKSLAQNVSSADAGSTSTGAATVGTDNDNDTGEVDCEYDGSVKNYLSCAKNRISTPMLIGAGIGITLGIFVLSFLCICLTKKKRRKAAQQKDQERLGDQVSSHGEDGKNVDLDDLEKNQNQSTEFFYPDDKKDVKLSFISAVGEEVKPKNPSNDNKNKSFELLAPPAPRNMHSRIASNSSSISNRPTILENGPTSLKPKPSIRKGSRDELYKSRPLKHAPSTRRPNPTFHKHMNQVSINGSIHGGEEREQHQSKSGEGSPVQFATKRELEITNPSQSQSRPNSVLEVQHPRPSQPPLRDTSNRRSVTHPPKPISRSSISQHPPPSYAMGPQPPPPASSTHNSYKPQMPLRGASQMTLALPPVLEDGKVSKSPSVASRQSTLAPPAESEDAGRSGTFGPGLISAEGVKKQVNKSSKVDADKVDIVEKEVSKDDKVFPIKYEKVGASRKVDEVKLPNITMSDSTTAPAHTLHDDQRPVESLTTTPAVPTLKDIEAPKEESDESKKPKKPKSRREELRQTNLIPSYYVKMNGLNFDDEEEEVVPTIVDGERDDNELNVDEKKQHAEVSKDQETAGKEKEKEREGEGEESLPNPFDAAEIHGTKGKKVRSEPKEKKERKAKHKKSKKSEAVS
ncbi:hypothetical protein L486_02419 [Kwoniella mangroviensis CBS 10435]|uniref:Uncharacterized protein n=1 Tax=Kwoniella mangroviensis CBS 10435 TaxID=1331196 RepID=A0A1B9IW52_9TREE|nr:hypothetical protein L486_02419 [Kwoniella mangroviensis CBS 10435]